MLSIRNILLPSDGSAWAERAFAHAAFFSGRHGARLHVLNVGLSRPGRAGTLVTDPPNDAGDFQRKLHEAASESVGVEIVHAEIAARSPEDGILSYAESHEIDLIVMATHGRKGVDHVLMGSTAEAVVRRAGCVVLTIRPTAESTGIEIDRIVVPIDFSEHAYLATAHAKELAQLFKATVCLVHVVEVLPNLGLADMPPTIPSGNELAEAHEALVELFDEAEGPACPAEFYVEIGHPAIESISAAKRLNADLMVISTHGRTGLKRLLMGSVAEKMVQQAPCPVFVVRAFGRSLLRSAKDRLVDTS